MNDYIVFRLKYKFRFGSFNDTAEILNTVGFIKIQEDYVLSDKLISGTLGHDIYFVDIVGIKKEIWNENHNPAKDAVQE